MDLFIILVISFFNFVGSTVNIPNPNSNILLTEDILIPCSCQVFGNEKNQFFIEVLLVLIGIIVAIISSIFVMMLIKFWQQKNFQAVALYVGLKYGNHFSCNFKKFHQKYNKFLTNNSDYKLS